MRGTYSNILYQGVLAPVKSAKDAPMDSQVCDDGRHISHGL